MSKRLSYSEYYTDKTAEIVESYYKKDVDLFGWDQAVAEGGRKLFITEGECDAAALYQVLKDA